ncbi:hypothetical protein K466DRAFT_380814 [Polyporus arcularius HHB13444]|uniref:Secreted protein n=1 Tax=Polyporus arcularius HHB13444 TaxID=1314778 RepID=A0A5C3PMG1_9APHY|nr:hypothetical protein K466DRAFT_380814 [Polyporus arcularius HHB13444]
MMCFYCWLLQGSVTVCFQVSLVQLAIVRGLSDVDVILTPSGFQPYTRTYQCYLDIVGKQIPPGHPMYLRILGCRYMPVVSCPYHIAECSIYLRLELRWPPSESVAATFE